jgi:hypothetical protein
MGARMIISEKQIMQLMEWAQVLCAVWGRQQSHHHELEMVATLIQDINNQQSEELKEIK